MDYNFGRLLALLKLKLLGELPDDVEISELEAIAELEEVLRSPETFDKWITLCNELPVAECREDDFVLSDRVALIGLFFLGFNGSESMRNRFFLHLINCFYCFNSLCEVLRGYLDTMDSNNLPQDGHLVLDFP